MAKRASRAGTRFWKQRAVALDRSVLRFLGICAAGLLIVSVALSVGVGSAMAGCTTTHVSQGDFVRGAGRDNGTRSYISGTATNNSCGFVWFSVAEQSHTPGDTTPPLDMMQAGEIKEDNNYGTGNDCNTDGALGRTAIIREWVSNDLGFRYQCDIYQNIARTDFGSGGNFAAVLATHWEAFYNSNQIATPVALGFSSGYTVARAEAQWTTSAPTYDVTWGPSGQTPKWQFKTDSSGCCTSYTNVANYGSTDFPGDGGWGFNQSSPPAFEITR